MPEAQAPERPLFANDSMMIQDFGGVSAHLSGSVPLSHTPPATGFAATSTSTPFSSLEEFIHDPDLEEAAILFANADFEGAAACLLDVLAQHAKDTDKTRLLEIWMTLFDLYRATGQQEDFDSLSLDFAAAFGRSAPLWFSIPEQLGLVLGGSVPSAPSAPLATALRRDFSWHAPATLGPASVAALQASLDRSAPPWTLIWDRLARIEESALPALVQEFTRWADAKIQLVSIGTDRLHTLLEAHTQSGYRANNPEWWRLRMAALRFMGRPDDFEMAALDYCVTYEVSPPSWQEPLCTYQDVSPSQAENPDDSLALDLLPTDPVDTQSSHIDTVPMALFTSDESTAPVWPSELLGHIESDATDLLQSFEDRTRPGQILVIPCDRLIRMDFSAAGAVLNWAAAQQAQKRKVEFRNLHRLAAVFFNVVGINEHAWITPRKN